MINEVPLYQGRGKCDPTSQHATKYFDKQKNNKSKVFPEFLLEFYPNFAWIYFIGNGGGGGIQFRPLLHLWDYPKSSHPLNPPPSTMHFL